MFGWLLGDKRNRAINALKIELKRAGFDTDYPPNESSTEYKVGAEIWVPMPEKATTEELKSNFDKIRAMTEKIATQFGLIAVGRGPVLLENALYFICCGFRRKPFAP